MADPDARAATIAFASDLIRSLVANTRELFEDDQMEAELPYLERLFLEKVEAAIRTEPRPNERSVVMLPPADGALGAAAAVKDEPAGEEEEGCEARARPRAAVDRMLYPSGVVPRIDNVMSHGNLGCEVNLARFAERVGNVVYEPKRHAALSLYLMRPKGTVQLYASGKLVCTGCRSEEDSRACARKCEALARSIGCRANLDAFRVSNIFASCDVDFDIKLGHLAAAYGLEYNPERSAKLTWHRSNPPIALEITAKGHVGLSGTTREQELSAAFEQVYPALKAHSMPRAAVALTTPAAGWQLQGGGGAQQIAPAHTEPVHAALMCDVSVKGEP